MNKSTLVVVKKEKQACKRINKFLYLYRYYQLAISLWLKFLKRDLIIIKSLTCAVKDQNK